MYTVAQAAKYLDINERRFQYLVYSKFPTKADSQKNGKNLYDKLTLDILAHKEVQERRNKENKRNARREEHIKTIQNADLTKVSSGQLTYMVSVLKRYGAV